jgi:NAD-dependent dihydropyrimidine dehydrogenase PreA subunit
MKKMLLYTVLAILALWAVAAMNTEKEITGFQGVADYRSGHLWLKGMENDEVRLLLAPQAVLDSLDFKVAAGDTIAVEGVRDNKLFLVNKLWNRSDGSNLYWLRYEYGMELRHDPSTYGVDTNKCIGCKLCFMNCPVGAISMVKGKAFIDKTKCVECGICIQGNGTFKGCPVRAIHDK